MATSKTYELTPETSINVLSKGTPNTKPTLIFLHFWGGSSRTYLPLLNHLAPFFHTLSISFRGWGSSVGPSSPDAYHIRTLSSDIQTLLPMILPPSHPFILIGHSMGAKVATHLTSAIQSQPAPYPHLLSLILLAPAPPSPLVLPSEMATQQMTAYDTLESAIFTIKHVLTAKPLEEEVITMLAEDMQRGNQWAKAAWPEYGMKEDYVEEARMIHVPTLVLAGGEDKVETTERVSKEVWENLRGVEEGRKLMRVLEGVGHLLMLEAMEVVIREIEKFVEVVGSK